MPRQRLVPLNNNRVSDSFYHLTGGRLFEGIMGGNFIHGTINVNPYYQLKLSSGNQLQVIKNVYANGRMAASVYGLASDLTPSVAGCSTLGQKISVASPREAALVIAVLIFPLGVILIAFSGGFTSEAFRKRKLMGMVIVITAVTLPLTLQLAPFASSNQAAYAPLLHSQLNDIILKVYGSAKIPPAEGQQAPKGEMGPREMQAIIEDRKRKPRIQLLNDADASTPSEGPVNEILYYHTDHLGSVRVITLSDGSVWKRSDYMPFGEIAFETVDTTSARAQTLNSFGYTHPKVSYTGQEKDVNSGLYYYGARFYDAEIGRFLQVDPVANILNPQSLNGFSYVGNNPINYLDPSGMGNIGSFYWGWEKPTSGLNFGFYWAPGGTTGSTGWGSGGSFGDLAFALGMDPIQAFVGSIIMQAPSLIFGGLTALLNNAPIMAPSLFPPSAQIDALASALSQGPIISGVTGSPPQPMTSSAAKPHFTTGTGGAVPDRWQLTHVPQAREPMIVPDYPEISAGFSGEGDLGFPYVWGKCGGFNAQMGGGTNGLYKFSGPLEGLAGSVQFSVNFAVGNGPWAGPSPTVGVGYCYFGFSIFESDSWAGFNLSAGLGIPEVYSSLPILTKLAPIGAIPVLPIGFNPNLR